VDREGLKREETVRRKGSKWKRGEKDERWGWVRARSR